VLLAKRGRVVALCVEGLDVSALWTVSLAENIGSVSGSLGQ
jgi:hypothetical protein